MRLKFALFLRLSVLEERERRVRVVHRIVCGPPRLNRHLIGTPRSRSGRPRGSCRSGLGRVGGGCDELQLVLAVANGPVACACSDDFDLLEKRALVPVLSDLGDLLAGLVEADYVNLG